MKLLRIALANYRGIRHVEVELAAEGITIIEGDNEVGKTSLAEALHLVFDYLDSSKSAAVKAVQPVHRDTGPEVEVELRTGPYHLVFAKRWLRRPSTTLTVLEPVRQQLTGREAHERVNQILDETVDRVLWEALRLHQGHDPADQGSYVMPSLSRALEAAVGAGHTDQHHDELWARIVENRDHYWTATGRPSAERVRLAERVAAAADRVAEIAAAIREVDDRTDELARLEAEAAELAASQVDLERRAAEAAEQLASVAELRRTLAQVEAEARGAAADHERWDALVVARQVLVAAVEQRSQALEATEAALAEAEPARREAADRLAEIAEARARAADAVQRAEGTLAQAAADTTYRRRQIEVEQFRERLARAQQAQEDLAAAEPVLAQPRVSAQAVEEIEAAQLEVARAEAVASMGAASVVAEAETATVIELDGRQVTLASGGRHEVSVTGSSELVVPGVVRIRVDAGPDAQAHAERLIGARAAFAERCAHYGVADLAEARRVAAAQADAERVHTSATERLAADLRDLSIEGLHAKIENLSAHLAEFEASRASDPPLPVDHAAAQEAEAAAAAHLARCREELADLDQRAAAAHEHTMAASVEGAALVERVKIDRAARQEAEAALAAARAERSDDHLAERAAEADRLRQRVAERLDEARRALAQADPDTLELVARNARHAVDRGRAAIAANHDRRQQLGALVADRGEQGLAHQLQLATAEADRLKLEADRLEARAEGARLLHTAFEARRTEARQRFVAPFRDRIEQLGRLVLGPSLAVELDDDLCIASRTLDGVTVPFDRLSTGAREQFALISRLACASLVGADGDGAPVVFDDVLGWTDPGRLAQMAAAVGVAARQCQVVILTCTPGRFAGVGAASVVRLEPQGPDEDAGDPSLSA